MNAQQAENLRILIRHMETRVTRTLNMYSIFEYPCGTPACALGEAFTVPELRAAGLTRGSISTDAETVFGLSRDEVEQELFSAFHRRGAWSGKATPQEWAAEARKVLAEHGYTMDDKAAEFVAGLEKLAREPLPVTTEHGTALFPE